MSQRFQTIQEFYPYYLTEHSDLTCRRLHFLGSTLALCWATTAVTTGYMVFMLYALLSGYGCAWVGHFFFEKNKPATFKYPLWSLMCDYIMYYDWLTMQLDPKLEAAKKKFPK
jgi:hypothetical protein